MSVVANLGLKPVTRQNLSDSITDSLRDAIFAGMFVPGQRLAEAQLAGQLKVSRAPIREALALLEREGLVHRLPSGGATVSRLSREDADEICTLRGIAGDFGAAARRRPRNRHHDCRAVNQPS